MVEKEWHRDRAKVVPVSDLEGIDLALGFLSIGFLLAGRSGSSLACLLTISFSSCEVGCHRSLAQGIGMISSFPSSRKAAASSGFPPMLANRVVSLRCRKCSRARTIAWPSVASDSQASPVCHWMRTLKHCSFVVVFPFSCVQSHDRIQKWYNAKMFRYGLLCGFRRYLTRPRFLHRFPWYASQSER